MRKTKYTPPDIPHKEEAYNLIAEVERKRADIDLRWGIKRFPYLVDPDLRERLRQMTDKYNDCKTGVNYLAMKTMAEGMLRGFDKCEASARKRGHLELDGQIWSFTYKKTGTQFLIVRDDEYYAKATVMAQNESPPPVVMSLLELMILIPKDSWLFAEESHKAFPGAKIIEPTNQQSIDDYGPISSIEF